MDLFQFYQFFPIDDHTGDPITDAAQVLLPCHELWLALLALAWDLMCWLHSCTASFFIIRMLRQTRS